MNIVKSKLPPSPKAKHARKPLFNKSVFTTNSLDKIKNKEKNICINDESTARSVRQRNFNLNSYEFEQKQNMDFSNPNIQTNAFTISRNVERHVCKHHRTRKATNYSENKSKEYWCFQCSLYEARRGTKLMPVYKIEEQKDTRRQNELKCYFNKIKQMQDRITLSINKKLQHMQIIQIECNKCLQNQKFRFQERMRKISQQYVYNLEVINSIKKQENKKIQLEINIMNEKFKLMRNNKEDIQKNYSECINKFNDNEFRIIMNKYWKHTYETLQTLEKSQNQINYEKVFNQIISRVMQKQQEKDLKQFTFSKKNIYNDESLNSNKKEQFEGIKIISSNYVTDNIANDSNCLYIKSSPLEV